MIIAELAKTTKHLMCENCAFSVYHQGTSATHFEPAEEGYYRCAITGEPAPELACEDFAVQEERV